MRPRHLAACLVVVLVVVSGVVLSPARADAQERRSVPATVVVVRTATTAGTYTVSWRTLGGCDPGTGTSGMSGEVVLTVEADGRPDDTPVPGELTGDVAEGVVVTRAICRYAWQVSLVEATTDAHCIVGPTPAGPDENNEINLTLTDAATDCSQGSRIVVRLNPATPAAVDEADRNAILRTTFRAIARRVEDAPTGCLTKRATSELDENDTPDDVTDDTVTIEMRVVDATARGEPCRYDVTLGLPNYLTATQAGLEQNVFEDVDPLATIDFQIGVANRTIFLVQDVVGDSGGAAVGYNLETICGDPYPIPENLGPRPSGGIQTIQSVTFVELRQGRFNITAAIAEDPTAPDAFDGVSRRALDADGGTCRATVTVSQVPDGCAAKNSTLTADLDEARERTILEFEFTCGDDPETAPDNGDEA